MYLEVGLLESFSLVDAASVHVNATLTFASEDMKNHENITAE